jgi:hypothetical protein
MKNFCYIVDRDFGFAPNPFNGYCTLADCKPRTRYSAQVGDRIFGLAGKKYRKNGSHRLIYAMKVTEILTFDEYFKDPRFQLKKPIVHSNYKRQYGDNIYYKDGTSEYHQLDSHHSFQDGVMHSGNRDHDTKIDKVLISNDYIYYGDKKPLIPQHLLNNIDSDKNIIVKRHHKNRFHKDFMESIDKYWESLPRGIYGNPNEW